MRTIPPGEEGRYTPVDGAFAYLPPPLPPGLAYDEELVTLLSEAERALGALNGVGRLQPNPSLLVVPYMRREAVVSSRIEGTQASLTDVLLLEAGQPSSQRPDDTLEVLNYLEAMREGVRRIADIPLHLNLICDMHRMLTTGVRGRNRAPGQYRSTQVWIGPPGTRIDEANYVPPPPSAMLPLLNQWETYLNTADAVPPLVKCAFLHYQFEALHPYLDGNGRIGRLVNMLYLLQKRVLEHPLLYLSGYFDRYRDEYYSHLRSVTEHGDWLSWVKYFARAVQTQALSAAHDCDRLLALLDDYRRRGHAAGNSRIIPQIVEDLLMNPFISARLIERAHDVTYKTANAVLTQLVAVGILEETTGRQRNRLFVAHELLAAVEGEDIESPPLRY